MATREYKQWLKDQKDLLELHKRCLKSELFYMGVENSTRRKFFKLYDLVIKPEFVREYFHKPLRVFIKALVKDQLEDIRDKYPSPKPPKRTSVNDESKKLKRMKSRLRRLNAQLDKSKGMPEETPGTIDKLQAKIDRLHKRIQEYEKH